MVLLVGGESVNKAAWWISVGLLVGGLLVIGGDEMRLRRLDARALTTDQWHYLRDTEYDRRQGVFLTHTLVPTSPPRDSDRQDEQWWSVTVELAQHGEGPLSRGQVKEVEYTFGPKFTEGPVKVQRPKDRFSYTTDLYGSLMVLARVVFQNPIKRPLLVERYISLPQEVSNS